MLMEIFQSIINGLMFGFILITISLGISLIYGVMGIVNFAHGEFLMIGMYIVYWMWRLYGWDPYLSMIVSVPILVLIGVLIQKHIIKPVLKAPHYSQIALTLALSIIMQNVALILWTGTPRAVVVPYASQVIELGGFLFSFPAVVASIVSLSLIVLLFFFLTKTDAGTALRAASQDIDAAELTGIDTEYVYVLAFALSMILVGVASSLLAPIYGVYPQTGTYFCLLAFVVVVLGGLEIKGTLIGGLIIGLTESLAGFLYNPGYKEIITFIIFMILLLLKPKGLMGEKT